MGRSDSVPVLVIHGGAGAAGLAAERPARRRAMLDAAARAVRILRAGGSALDAAVAAVAALENHPLFNAGYGSALNAEGVVEMDASVMVAGRPPRAGAVAAVGRVRNPVLLAQAVMERTDHVLMVGRGAERLAAAAGVTRCVNAALVTARARKRWRAFIARGGAGVGARPLRHGTVGAVALDSNGQLAAATSTGGITGKLRGRVGDSAIIGAGTFADALGAASATGTGEAIIKATLCREVVRALRYASPAAAARRGIARLGDETDGQAGVIVVDRKGRVGYAHNAESMEIVVFEKRRGVRYLRPGPR